MKNKFGLSYEAENDNTNNKLSFILNILSDNIYASQDKYYTIVVPNVDIKNELIKLSIINNNQLSNRFYTNMRLIYKGEKISHVALPASMNVTSIRIAVADKGNFIYLGKFTLINNDTFGAYPETMIASVDYIMPFDGYIFININTHDNPDNSKFYYNKFATNITKEYIVAWDEDYENITNTVETESPVIIPLIMYIYKNIYYFNNANKIITESYLVENDILDRMVVTDIRPYGYNSIDNNSNAYTNNILINKGVNIYSLDISNYSENATIITVYIVNQSKSNILSVFSVQVTDASNVLFSYITQENVYLYISSNAAINFYNTGDASYKEIHSGSTIVDGPIYIPFKISMQYFSKYITKEYFNDIIGQYNIITSNHTSPSQHMYSNSNYYSDGNMYQAGATILSINTSLYTSTSTKLSIAIVNSAIDTVLKTFTGIDINNDAINLNYKCIEDCYICIKSEDGDINFKNTGNSNYIYPELNNALTFKSGNSPIVIPFIVTYELRDNNSYNIQSRISALTDRIDIIENNQPQYIDNTIVKMPMFKYQEINDSIGYLGRWYDKEFNGTTYKVTNNDGANIFFKVEGQSSITLNWYNTGITTNMYYSYSIDGGEFTRTLITNNIITLPDTGEHIIWLVTDGVTEGYGKWNTGKGFGFNGCNVQTTGLLPKNKIIQFYGDSITEGIRALGIDSDDMGNTNSSTGAYPWFCCSKLDCVPYFVGYGATGVTTTGSFHPFIDAIDYFYNGVKIKKTYPDLICVNHGTNDGGANSETFKAGYIACLDRLRIVYPGVKIACVVPFNQTHAIDIRDCCQDRPDCTYISTSGWKAEMSFWSGDNTHPASAGAKVAGEKLADALLAAGLI